LRIYPVKISGLVGRRFLVSALWASKDELDKSDNVVGNVKRTDLSSRTRLEAAADSDSEVFDKFLDTGGYRK
jgi:hypothetical protein